jgi:hypothetical protein
MEMEIQVKNRPVKVKCSVEEFKQILGEHLGEQVKVTEKTSVVKKTKKKRPKTYRNSLWLQLSVNEKTTINNLIALGKTRSEIANATQIKMNLINSYIYHALGGMKKARRKNV